MLDPKYLERFSDQLLGIIDTLTIAIISDMAKRIVKMGNVSESTTVSYTHLTLPTNREV